MAGNNYNFSIGGFLSGSPEFNSSSQITPQLTSKPVNQPTFDPEEGMYDAYIEARNAAIGANASKRKQERFYKKFRKQWDEGETLRKSEFEWNQGMAETNAKIDNLKKGFMDRTNQMVQDFTNNITPIETKPVQTSPVNNFKTDFWLAQAQNTNPAFKSIDEVKKWQEKNGLVADGKFGEKSLAKWNELNSKPQTVEEAQQKERANGRLTVPVPEEAYAGNTSQGSSIPSLANVKTADNNSNIIYTNAGTVYNPSTTGAAKLWNAVKGFGQWLAGPKEPIQTNTPVYKPKNIFMETGKAIHNTFGNANKHKNGGNINKYQQGGNMNDQELQKAFMAYLIEDAATQGMQIQSEQDLQAYAQQLGEEGLKAKYQEFMQKMQGGVKAALGAKLNYIHKLKGNCPDGYEMVYMKEGGRVCPVCQQKAQGGKKLEEKKKNVISDFKEKRKAVNPNDTVHVGGKPKSLTNADGSRVDKRFPAYTNEDYKKDKNTKDGQKRRMKADLVSSEKCGGKAKKAKKHFFGGDFSINDAKNPMRMSDGTQMVGVIHRQRFKNATNRGMSQTLYDSTGRPIIQKDKTSNGGEREIYYNSVRTPIKRKGLFSPGHVMKNDTVYISGTPEMFENSPNMSTPEIKQKAYRFAQGM